MKNIRIFLAEKFPFWMVKFSVYLNRRVFVMMFLQAIYADSEGPDQTAHLRSLIWAFAAPARIIGYFRLYE